MIKGKKQYKHKHYKNKQYARVLPDGTIEIFKSPNKSDFIPYANIDDLNTDLTVYGPNIRYTNSVDHAKYVIAKIEKNDNNVPMVFIDKGNDEFDCMDFINAFNNIQWANGMIFGRFAYNKFDPIFDYMQSEITKK